MEILITEAQIQDRVRQLGRQIEADYQGKPLTIVAVLTGSLILLADLIRQIHLPCGWRCSRPAATRARPPTAGALIINEAFVPDVAGRDVLLLDDILDTGHTLATLVHRMSDRGARSVRTAVLLRKIGRQEVYRRSHELTADWIAAALEDPAVRRDLITLLRAMRPEVTRRAAEQLVGFDRPALVVWAALDAVFPIADGRRLAQLLGARFVLVEDSRAFVPLDQPARVAELVAGFVGERSRAAA